MKDSTTGYCSCCAGMFDCTTGSEESKKLRRAREILAGQLIYLFAHPTWSCRIFLVRLYLMDLILDYLILVFFVRPFQFI